MSLFSALHCPYCWSAFEIDSAAPDPAEGIYGILRCGCHDYPVVEGIPIIQHVDGLDRVVEFIRGNEPKRALLQALNVFRVRWAHRSRWHQVRYHLNCRRLVSDAALTFEDAAQLVRTPKIFADYLVHRYANPSFLAAVGTLLVLKCLEKQNGGLNRDGSSRATDGTPRLLDLACGAGHSSFLIRLLYPGLSVISADQDFVSLYLARRFLAPDTTQVCWDVEVPSPFPDHWFDGVFCLDAFHYFKSKRAVASELKRILTPGALWLFPHLHNRLQHNIVAGIPLSPDAYFECFDLPDARLFDESRIFHALSERRVLDLGIACTPSQLNASPTLTLVRGSGDVWRTHDGFPGVLRSNRSNLVVNPIYRGRSSGGDVELELGWPNEVMKNECRGAEAVLPAKCRVSKADLASLGSTHSAPKPESLDELIAKFVLVPLPRQYLRDNRAAG